MSRYIEELRNDREKTRIEENNNNNKNNISLNQNYQQINPQMEYEFEKIRQENSILKSDNIIFREDINRLADLNRHYEEEIRKQRERK